MSKKLDNMCMHVANILRTSGVPCTDEALKEAILHYEESSGFLVAIHTKPTGAPTHDRIS